MTAEPAEPAGAPQEGRAPQFPSDEWVGWLDATLSQCRVDDSLSLVLRYRVASDDGPHFCWDVRIQDGRVSASPAQSDEAAEADDQPHVTLTSDHDTAHAIALESSSAQRAFAEGRLRLSGDPLQLTEARPALEAIGKALAEA